MHRWTAVGAFLGAGITACTSAAPDTGNAPDVGTQASASVSHAPTAPNSASGSATVTGARSGSASASPTQPRPSASVSNSAATQSSSAPSASHAPSSSSTAEAAGTGTDAGDSGVEEGGVIADSSMPPLGTPVVYVGGFDYASETYPITTYDLDKQTGALSARTKTVDGGSNPSYLTLAPGGKFLYAANEVDGNLGGLSSFTIDANGDLTKLNHVTGTDGGFTYVAVAPSGKFIFGASYNGGSISIFPIETDGSIGEQLDNQDFGGGAQSHCVGFDASGKFVFVPNKGLNQVGILNLADDGQLSPATPASFNSASPRHIAVRRDGTQAFVISENANTLTSLQINASALTELDTISTLPNGFTNPSTGAHVELSADERFVFASNRGHDSIAAFEVDEAGSLTLVEHEPTGGDTPRDFEVDPAGDVLIVANQDSNTLTVFRITESGGLDPLGEPVAGPGSPSAVQIAYINP